MAWPAADTIAMPSSQHRRRYLRLHAAKVRSAARPSPSGPEPARSSRPRL
jgi:hypothetical protein